jgi:hypothetical protein
MALQLQTAYDTYSRFKQDISDVDTDVFLDWCRWLQNFMYRYRLGIEPNKYFSTQSYTITTSPSTQALPTDFKEMTKFGTGIFRTDASGNVTDDQLAYTGRGRADTGYYFDGDNVIFTGADNLTVTMVYIPSITLPSALTDYFTIDTLITGKDIISEEWLDDFVVKALDVMYSQWDEMVGYEGIADARFVRILNEFASDIRRAPGVYGLDDTSLNF